MAVESIFDKKIIKGTKSSTFKGLLFYVIILDKKITSVAFYYTRANTAEVRSVTRDLPLFIRDYFKSGPSFFCDSCATTETLDGKLDYVELKFLLA